MKRRTKSYIITHVAYNANLRIPKQNKPISWKELMKWLFILFSILYFLIGTAIAKAEVKWLPNSPSKDLSTFKRQIIILNSSRLLDQIKENSSSVKHLSTVAAISSNVTTTVKPSALFSTKLGAQPKDGKFFIELKVVDSLFKNTLDITNKLYCFEFHIKPYTLTYLKPLKLEGYSIAIARSFSIE